MGKPTSGFAGRDVLLRFVKKCFHSFSTFFEGYGLYEDALEFQYQGFNLVKNVV
jgi:hypothetical protein